MTFSDIQGLNFLLSSVKELISIYFWGKKIKPERRTGMWESTENKEIGDMLVIPK